MNVGQVHEMGLSWVFGKSGEIWIFNIIQIHNAGQRKKKIINLPATDPYITGHIGLLYFNQYKCTVK